jgi:adenylylsulfate kinase-like enzyme
LPAVSGVEVLVLHGSPGSGKSTLARAVAEVLREADVPNAILDPDDLSQIHPYPGKDFSRANMAALWPNFVAVSAALKVLVPAVFDDAEDMAAVRAAVPADRFLVCELTAPIEVLKERTAAREPNEFWRKQLIFWVDHYHEKPNMAHVADFTVSTHDRAVDDAAREIAEKAGWLTRP